LDTATLLQIINLVVFIGGGGLGIGILIGKVNALVKQVNGGFSDNREDHRVIFLTLGRHEKEISGLELGKIDVEGRQK
jgi:hypothetical protein